MIPLLALLLALAGMTFSVIGEASSHGIAELNESVAVTVDQDNHSHNHDDFDEKSDSHPHHDAGNHSHESADRLTSRFITGYSISLRLLMPSSEILPAAFVTGSNARQKPL